MASVKSRILMRETDTKRNGVTRVALVGAGYISRVHAEILRRTSTARLNAIVDTDLAAATTLARKWGVSKVFKSIAEAIDADAFDCAHILVPPNRHAEIALTALAGNKSVFLEKPMASTVAECDALVKAAAISGRTIAINQNFIFHPAFVRLQAKIASARLGKPRAAVCVYNVPLRQMSLGQSGHWMFDQPVNLLLEQAVHPLSQIVELVGNIVEVQAIDAPALELGVGRNIYPEVTATLVGEKLPVQFRFAVGQSFPSWELTVICDDGVLVADILNNRVYVQGRTRWHPAIDNALSATHTGAAIIRDGWAGCAGAAASLLNSKVHRDPYIFSMQRSIGAFYEALSNGSRPRCDASFGRDLVGLCFRIGSQAFPKPVIATRQAHLVKPIRCDVAVIGGTGFIGKQVVKRFLREGHAVSVLARTTPGAITPFDNSRVVLHRGDARVEQDVARAVGDARIVINLAVGGGDTWEAVRSATTEGVEALANVSQRAQVERIIHISSIAALYLGAHSSKITGATRIDPRQERRGIYARGKALGEQLFLQMHIQKGIPVTILRPSIVVGEGAQPLHSGLGFYNNEQHCLGWNRGQNALPFVLVTDVAEAILLATLASKEVLGRCYNLVGDVRPCAREYISRLAEAQGRSFRFHPQSPTKLWLVELSKGLIKRLKSGAISGATHHDILSRGMTAEFDVSDVKRELGWHPVAHPDTFYSAALKPNAT